MVIVVVVVVVLVVVVGKLPKAFTSFRWSGRSPLSICTMTYLPFAGLPDHFTRLLNTVFQAKVYTWDCDYILSFSGWSSITAQQGSSKKLLTARGRKLFGDAHLNISTTAPTAFSSVEDLDPINGKCSAIVNGKPGIELFGCVANSKNISNPYHPKIITSCVPVNTIWCSQLVSLVGVCRR